MGFNCGIVGLPNVGKSTLFNALTGTQAAQAANFPFCTIEPNLGKVAVPDPRLEALARLAASQKIVPTQLEFVDIAGLVKGASTGEGLGNRFLANIREVDAIVHVLRCFESEVAHVEGSIDPCRDAEIVNTELMIADLESLEKRLVGCSKRARTGDKEARETEVLLLLAKEALDAGRPARLAKFTPEQARAYSELQLITARPVLYLCNLGEDEASTGNAHSRAVEALAKKEGAGVVNISAEIEAEIALMEAADRQAFLESLGLGESGLDRLIVAGYELLDLISFFTAGPKEARAWTIRSGSTAPEAAGVIHSDFERGFIRAETVSYDDYILSGGEAGAREAGKLRLEGKNYEVQDGDVIHFRFNV